MTAEQLRSLHRASPFAPFRVHMANGRYVDIPHPDFMHLSPTGRRLIVDTSDDAFEIVDVLLVTSVESLPQNGSTRKRQRRKKA